MWIIGVLAYFLFHRIAIVFYLGMFTRASAERPLAAGRQSFHLVVNSVSVALLIISGICFYLSSPWLAVLPIVFLGLSLATFRVNQGQRTNDIIKKATEIQVRMEREGRPQTEINKAVYLGATGRLYPIESDADLKSFLRYSVLSEVIGFDAHADLANLMENMGNPNYVSASDKIDAGVDQFHHYWSKHYDDIARFRH